ncbi:Oidioi.mRNA.OKI2018_I69.PAR.g12767.t1.cds [Oikopleura dioica]|uniref:Oidioi.mRNA.OKI2018_I69.PAR.g12767.t1.cds n=1 Tax=Oikopleura dioica TaxID=34765 RepID=A0ABN7S515_OIKDI|nr:Oidioi.mRNA.OKI2018_I69.PAR.g12767.t1.cds [Oikopleura dioica]
MDSDDDTPLDSLLNRKPKAQSQPKSLFTRWQSITDKVYAIKVQNTTQSELTPANRALLEENLEYDESKYFVSLTNVILVQLVEKPKEKSECDENKENQPVATQNGENSEAPENTVEENGIHENGIQEIEDSDDEENKKDYVEECDDDSDEDNFVFGEIETVTTETFNKFVNDSELTVKRVVDDTNETRSVGGKSKSASERSTPVITHEENGITTIDSSDDEDSNQKKTNEDRPVLLKSEHDSNVSSPLLLSEKENSDLVAACEKVAGNKEKRAETPFDSSKPDSAQEESDDDLIEVVQTRQPEIDTFWCIENGKIYASKAVPPSFQLKSSPPNPDVDLSVGGLYYKIYAAIQERRQAQEYRIKPIYIAHRRLYLAADQKNYSTTIAFMEAAKEAYLDKLVDEDIDLSANTFCRDCFRVFPTGFDLQVHRELVHSVQHAATCRVCEFNFGQPATLLKHMAAVHSKKPTSHQPGLREVMGAYKCHVCKFCSPLYSELIRHFKEYHSKSGWLLCPFCIRCFSSDVQYENHLQVHINKAKFYRCQSCRLVFESEQTRSRHEMEMHGREKWMQVEPNPHVPIGTKVWVRGEPDCRSKLVDTEGLEDNQAVRALCLRDCSKESSKQNISGGKRKALPKGVEKLVPKHLVVAKKAFREEVLSTKRRSQAVLTTTEKSDEEIVRKEIEKNDKIKLIPVEEGGQGWKVPQPNRNNFPHMMSELFYFCSEATDETPAFPLMPSMEETNAIKVEILAEEEKMDATGESDESPVNQFEGSGFADVKTDPMFSLSDVKKEKSIFDIEQENEILKKQGVRDTALEDINMDGKYHECVECKTKFASGAELIAHFLLKPIKTAAGSWDTHCPVLGADRKSLELREDAPSMLKYLTAALEPVWNNEPRNDIKKSYPEGILCSCGFHDKDYTDATAVVKHIQRYPKHTLIIPESQAHKDSIFENQQRKRLKQMIQAHATKNQLVADLDLSITDKLTMKQKYLEDQDDMEELMETLPEEMKKLQGTIQFKRRVDKSTLEDRPLHKEERSIVLAADGPNLESVIQSRLVSSVKIPRKLDRSIQSIFKKRVSDIETQKQLEAQQKKLAQSQSTQKLALGLQNHAPIKPNYLPVGRPAKTVSYTPVSQEYILQHSSSRSNAVTNVTQTYRTVNSYQNSTTSTNSAQRVEFTQLNRPPSQQKSYNYTPSNYSRNQSPVNQRSPINQNTGPKARAETLCGRLPRSATTHRGPVTPADCKFPMVSHKCIHVEIIPSDDAKKFANIDQYEIMFKGKKQPNIYKVRPSIKVVKLIGLQSDTLYEIKVYATRHGVRSPPLIRNVRTPKKPRGVVASGEIIELD